MFTKYVNMKILSLTIRFNASVNSNSYNSYPLFSFVRVDAVEVVIIASHFDIIRNGFHWTYNTFSLMGNYLTYSWAVVPGNNVCLSYENFCNNFVSSQIFCGYTYKYSIKVSVVIIISNFKEIFVEKICGLT